MKTKNQNSIFLAFIFSLLSLATATAQSYWCSYRTEINVKKYEGHRFRFTALIKAQAEDDSSECYIWTRAKLNSGGYGVYYSTEDRSVRINEWRKYEIEGTVDSNAGNMVIGAVCVYNGKFFFDDMKLEFEETKDNWVTGYANNFETVKLDFVNKTSSDPDDVNKPSCFNPEIKKGEAGEGKMCLVITGVGVPLYGINSKVGKFANVNGIKLYYEIYGQGQPLLILHGNGGSIANAGEFYPELIKKYKLIAVDSRAQGKSTDTDQILTYDLLTSDINLLLEELKIDSVLLWGHSDGAILGILLAKDYPKKVKKVIASGPNMQPDTNAVFPWIINYCKAVIDTTKNKTEKKLYQMILDYPNVPYTDLRKIKAPVLLTAGDRDMIRPEHMVKLFQYIPNSQLCIMPGSTHFEEWEHKDYFMKLMTDFFDNPFTMRDTHDFFK